MVSQMAKYYAFYYHKYLRVSINASPIHTHVLH